MIALLRNISPESDAPYFPAVGAPDMRDMPELFGVPRNLLFVKSVLCKIRFHARNEAIYVQHLRCKITIRPRLCGGN